MRRNVKPKIYGLFVKRIGVMMRVLEGQEFEGLSLRNEVLFIVYSF